MRLDLIRDDADQRHNWGKLYIDGKYFCETLEDKDRYLEAGGEKVAGDTAIPRGNYKVILSPSARFDCIMPEVMDVPNFTGVRLHGGNTEVDTSGCPLLGAARNYYGVANCSGVNTRLRELIKDAIDRKEEVWMEVL